MKALACTLLSAALIGGTYLPAQALPGTDVGGGTGQVAVAALTPAAAAAKRPLLKLGTRGPAVVYVQGKLGVTPRSGYFGTRTEAAVRRLQATKGLRATGTVTPATWKLLLPRRPATAPAPPPAPGPSPAQEAAKRPLLEQGSQGPAVVFVQQYLKVTPATGYFGTRTRAATVAYQAGLGISATGKVGPLTWAAIHAGRRPTTPPAPAPSTPPATPAPPAPGPSPAQEAAKRPLLEQGSQGPAVVFVQQYLKVTPATGYFGTRTRAATVAYQAGLGISATGQVGPLTWAAIHAGRRPTTPPAPAPGTIPTPTYKLPRDPAPRDHALVFALAQVGKPYVLGGNGPDVFDCSGLVQQAYLAAGVRLPRLASQQRYAGTEVTIDDLLPGDLLYYQDGSSPRRGHISMYAGDGLVVEAANPRRGVRIRTLHEAWYRDRFVAATRIG
jgi:cell wall-associated NlpC family hydrolase